MKPSSTKGPIPGEGTADDLTIHLDNLGIEKPIRTLRIGVSIQDTENPPGFVCDDCTVWHRCWEIDEDAKTMLPTCAIDKDSMKIHGCIPNRCTRCANLNAHWQLGEKYKKNLVSKFNKRRHHHIRMITWGWLGEREITPTRRFTDKTTCKICNTFCVCEQVTKARNEMVSGMKALREYQLWKEHVDGGIWFYECTYSAGRNGQIHINPHMHLVVLCPKMFPVEQMNNQLFDEQGLVREEGTRVSKLGRCHIHSTRCKETGKFLRPAPEDAANYCVSYAKRPGIQGKSRNQFGILTRRRCFTPPASQCLP